MDSVMVVSVLSASLLGSLHCVGMCGGLVTVYAGQAQQGPEWTAHAAYNLGRLSIYTLLGALAGLLGAGLNLAGELLSFQAVAMRLAGAWMVLWGLYTLVQAFPALQERVGTFPNPLRRLSAHVMPFYARLRMRKGLGAALGVGLLSATLPCGWLYLFVGTAAGAGSAAAGASMMAVFWLGTLPALATLGVVVKRLSGRLRAQLPLVAALLLVCAGLYTVTGKLGALGTSAAAFQQGAAAQGSAEAGSGTFSDHACH